MRYCPARRGRDGVYPRRTAHHEENRPPDHPGPQRPLCADTQGKSAFGAQGCPRRHGGRERRLGGEHRGRGRPRSRPYRTPFRPHRPADDTLFPEPARCSASAATLVTSTASAPPKKSCTGSPACPSTSPAPNNSGWYERQHWIVETVSTGPAMLRSTRTLPSSEPPPRPGPWSPSATWR
jgi:hypothetical protein